MARKTETSYEVKRRWNKKTYKAFQVNLRYDTDQRLIDFLEANRERYGTTSIFRDALTMYIESDKHE